MEVDNNRGRNMIKKKEPGKQFKGTAEERFYFYFKPGVTEPAPYGLARPCQVGWQGSMALDDGSPRPQMHTGERDEAVAVWLHRTRIGGLREGWQVLHRCDNAQCLELSHLEQGEVSQNNGPDRIRAGTSNRKLSGDDVRRAWDDMKSDQPHWQVAEKLGVCPEVISRIFTGKEYQEFRTADDEEFYQATRPAKRRPNNVIPPRRFTAAQALEVKLFCSLGIRKATVAKWFGCSPELISQIAKGRLYKDVRVAAADAELGFIFMAFKFIDVIDIRRKIVEMMKEATEALTPAQIRGIQGLDTPFNRGKPDFLKWLAEGYKVSQAQIAAVLARPEVV